MSPQPSSSERRGAEDAAIQILAHWYGEERGERDVAIGIANGALHLLEYMHEKFPLEPADYTSKGGSQVKGISGAHGNQIIRRFLPEARSIGTEAGRTSRGTLPAVERLATRLNKLVPLAKLTPKERARLADKLQRWLVENPIRTYFGRQKLEASLDPGHTSLANIAALLQAADERNQAGAVAQHLVGAKLALRFPRIEISNHSFTTADAQLERSGDFLVNDTALHITMTPSPLVFPKCERNIRDGFRVILLVPDSKREGARQMADSLSLGERVAVLAIESFVGQNLDEIAEFSQNALEGDLRKLLETYNARVAECEPDRSLLIAIPGNLGNPE